MTFGWSVSRSPNGTPYHQHWILSAIFRPSAHFKASITHRDWNCTVRRGNNDEDGQDCDDDGKTVKSNDSIHEYTAAYHIIASNNLINNKRPFTIEIQ